MFLTMFFNSQVSSMAAAVSAVLSKNVLLLKTTGATGSTNNVFIDSSPNASAITRVGNVTQGRLSPFSPNGFSCLFGGNTTADNVTLVEPLFSADVSSLTIECWINFNKMPTANWFSTNAGWGGNMTLLRTGSYSIMIGSTNFYLTGASDYQISSHVMVPNQWYHIAITKIGGLWSAYVNGVLQGSTTNGVGAFTIGSTTIGSATTSSVGTAIIDGKISNFRTIDGIALYTANFTPSTVPLTAINGTTLLTFQDGRLKDNSGTNKVISTLTTPCIQPVSPFAPTVDYSPSLHGGSAYFDGSGDYLTTPATSNLAFGTGDFTVECWIYPQAARAAASMLVSNNYNQSSGVGNWAFYVTGLGSTTNLWFNLTGANHSSSVTTIIPVGIWTHLSYSRSGTTGRFFINGIQLGTNITDSSNYSGTAGTVYIGDNSGAGGQWNGYMANVRILKNTALYTASFIPENIPAISIANTQLLLNFTNTNVFDNANINNIETVSTTQTSTVVTKFNTGSIKFNGTSDYLNIPATAAISLPDDFTVECWVYPTLISGAERGIVGNGSDALVLRLNNGTNKVQFWLNSSTTGIITSNAVVQLNTWTHIALVRNGTAANNVSLFINGVLDIQATKTFSIPSAVTVIGRTYITNPIEYFQGYIEDLRITKGQAVYTTSFTPPTITLSTITDPYFNKVALLLDGEGVNNGTNNVFIDSSSNNLTITRNGTPAQGSVSPYTPAGWSGIFKSTDNITLSNADSNSAFGATAEFTIEAWINPTGNTWSLVYWTPNVNAKNQWSLTHNSGNGLVLTFQQYGSSQAVVTSAGLLVPLNTWTHVVIQRDISNVFTIFFNGVAKTITNTLYGGYIGYNLTAWSGSAIIGGGTDTAKISNFRFTRAKVYNTAFTPSTTPLVAIAGTSLLTLQDNRFKDNSSNNFLFGSTGTPIIQPVSPFVSTVDYSSDLHGGSGYFNSTTDCLTIPVSSSLAFGTGDFTVEMWLNLIDTTANQRFYLNGQSGTDYLVFTINTSGQLQIGINNSYLITYTLPSNIINSWHHLALVRLGTSLQLYIDGISVANVVNSTNLSTNYPTYIGGLTWASGYSAHGYISNLRVVKGTAVYTANFTSPTSPLTAIANTQLLLNFTNGSVIDKAGKVNITTAGTAKLSTIQKKTGTSSMYFDGSTTSLILPITNILELGSNDFTIEGWFNFTAATTRQTLFFINGNTFGYASLVVEFFSTGKIGWSISETGTAWKYSDMSAGKGSVLSTNTWHHVVVRRVGGIINLFVNGILIDSVVLTTTTTSLMTTYTKNSIGVYNTTYYYLNGYIDDFRITMGKGRYTVEPIAAL